MMLKSSNVTEICMWDYTKSFILLHKKNLLEKSQHDYTYGREPENGFQVHLRKREGLFYYFY